MQPWDLINPVTATVVARTTPDDFPPTLLSWLPERDVQDVRARTARTQRTNSTARFRSWDSESPLGERGFTQTVSEVRFPPISEKLPLTETDRLQLFLAQQDGLNGPALDALVQAAYDDIASQSRRIRNRMELARGDVLVDGKFTLTAENGLTLEADFGLVSDQKPVAGTLWSNSAATPVDDERGWITYLETLSGKPITRALTSRKVFNYLLANAQYRQTLFPGLTLANIPTLRPDQLRTVREMQNLPPVEVYEHQLSVDGSATRVLPENRFILGAAAIGETQWGVTPDALDLAKSGAVVVRAPGQGELGAAGLVAGTWQTTDPTTKWTKVSGCGMPVIGDVTGLLTATVLA